MANRYEKPVHDIISFKMATASDEGFLATYDTANAGFVVVPATAAGEKVAGLLTTSVVNKDFGAQPVNHQNPREVGLSGTVRLLTVGEVETSSVVVTDVPGPGSGAYIADNGLLTTSNANERVGTFLTAKDSDGLVRVWLNID